MIRCYIKFLIILLALSFNNKVNAQSHVDCTKSDIEINKGDTILTKEEEIAIMDKELYKSLSKFEKCIVNSSTSSSSSSSSSNSSSASNDYSSADARQDATEISAKNNIPEVANSVPSQSISGTEEYSEESSPDTDISVNIEEDNTNDGTQRDINQTLENGKIPDDIPPSDNDTVLEKQIRRAAMEAEDPEKKKRLWNRYREYKGLELKE